MSGHRHGPCHLLSPGRAEVSWADWGRTKTVRSQRHPGRRSQKEFFCFLDMLNCDWNLFWGVAKWRVLKSQESGRSRRTWLDHRLAPRQWPRRQMGYWYHSLNSETDPTSTRLDQFDMENISSHLITQNFCFNSGNCRTSQGLVLHGPAECWLEGRDLFAARAERQLRVDFGPLRKESNCELVLICCKWCRFEEW